MAVVQMRSGLLVDGDVQVEPPSRFVGLGSTPIGAVTMFGAETAPAGWLLCDGEDVSRTTYADLYAVIGTAFGVGDGSTTFGLPNMQYRMAFGFSDGVNNVGDQGGAVEQTLVNNNLPAHAHSFSATSGAASANHTHLVAYQSGVGGGASSFHGSFALTPNASVPTAGVSADHTHSVSGSTGTTGIGAAFSILNNHTVLAFIIYAGV